MTHEDTAYFGEFMPHGMCYLWRPDILAAHVISDALIAIAYFSIPVALFYFLRKRTDFPFRSILFCFSVFIFACGVTHVMGIWVVWNGYYGLQGIFKIITASASVITAVLLFPVMPKLIALRSPQELEESNSALQQEIHNRKLQENQTFQLQSELAHISRISTMGEMATGLAHELNQPLFAISQNSDMALLMTSQLENSDPELIECIKDIQTDALRAGEIIRALRQLVNKENPERSEFDLTELTEQVIRVVSPEARRHNISIQSARATNLQPYGDRVQIAQVMVNLLRNAIQAIGGTDSATGTITITATQQTDAVEICIVDNGPGFATDKGLFKPFETNKTDGMGMGLTISRSIIESHGGTLTAENLSERGARFAFTLPLHFTEKPIVI